MKYCLITDSGGIVGSEAVRFFVKKGYTVIGIDNDSTNGISNTFKKKYISKYIHSTCDIRKYDSLEEIFTKYPGIECIIHCAAQSSHDSELKEPLTATSNVLELTKKYVQSASFIFMSTNKVYGENLNVLQMRELETRFEVDGQRIDETMPVSEESMVQEYGRQFGMNTVVFRGGYITGPPYQGAQFDGFLPYLVKCICNDESYTIFGYKGKQVRDSIHSFDVVNAFWHYHNKPIPAAVYNIGGGIKNSLSVLETIDTVNTLIGKKWNKYTYIDENRSGDPIWYITNLSKFTNDYPEWNISYSMQQILKEMIQSNSKLIVTSKLRGGLGNQMFQIAVAYAFSKKYNVRMMFHKKDFKCWHQGSHPRKYYTNLYEKIEFVDSIPPAIQMKEKKWTWYDVFSEFDMRTFDKEKPTTVCFSGCWQSLKYFEEYRKDIQNFFTPDEGILHFLQKNSNIFERFPELMEEHDFVFMGVRRGDYIKFANIHNPCGFSYYSDAMQKLKKSRYYISSDDVEWCKKKFVGEQFRFFDINDDVLQFFVSTLFKNYIISNSTYYWWGSFMSIYSNPTIVAPDKWLFGKNVTFEKYSTIYRPEMIILERSIETD